MSAAQQLSFLDASETRGCIAALIKNILKEERQPSARELVAELDRTIGIVARWDLESVLASLKDDMSLKRAERGYLRSLLEADDFVPALRGKGAPDQEIISTIDALLEESGRYRHSYDFRELMEFVGRFKAYSPYNNMLVRIQNPSCGYYATAKDWLRNFRRWIKPDARPMLILAPKHPVLLVYDLDQTDGPELPAHLLRFAQFDGEWDYRWMERLIENARRHRIQVDFRQLSSLHAGFATFAAPQSGEKMQIVINSELVEPSQFGVLCHEMAHILLGHLGSDDDHWWPSRSHLGRVPIEIEAEATAYVATRRLELEGTSAAYVSRYLGDHDEVPKGVSYDMIAKVAGRIERMALNSEPAPQTKTERAQRRSR